MTRIEELVRDTMIERADGAPLPAPVIQRALAGEAGRRRGRVVTLAAFGTAASIAVAVCVGLLVDTPKDGDNPGTPAATASATPGQDAAGDVRLVEIYAAAIERAMTEFIATTAHPHVPESIDVAGPVDVAEQAAITDALADVTALHWVDELPCVECGEARRPGLQLRPIDESDSPNRVEVDGYVMDLERGNPMSLHTHALAYIIEERDGTWQYAGPVPSGPPNPICDGIPAGEPRC